MSGGKVIFDSRQNSSVTNPDTLQQFSRPNTEQQMAAPKHVHARSLMGPPTSHVKEEDQIRPGTKDSVNISAMVNVFKNRRSSLKLSGQISPGKFRSKKGSKSYNRKGAYGMKKKFGNDPTTPLFAKNNTMNLQSRNADVSTVKALLKLTE